jgi:abortive infection bacteriophage resistance protein
LKYSKPALSAEEQVEVLQKRGMQIADAAAVARRLEHLNYYRIRAYWLPFEVKAEQAGEHKFREGTSFEQVMQLYDFDRQLRLLVLNAIERVEVSLRTRLAHTLCLKYGSHPQLKPDLFRDRGEYDGLCEAISEEVARSSETFIAHYRAKYTDPSEPPLWAVVEVMSFGLLSRFFAALDAYADRRAISKAYDLNEKVLETALHHLAVVRNVCAHHSRLWNRTLTVALRIPQNPSFLRDWFNPQEPAKVYNSVVMLAYLLRHADPSSDWLEQLTPLVESCPLPLEKTMGFPDGWRKLPLWKPFAKGTAI